MTTLVEHCELLIKHKEFLTSDSGAGVVGGLTTDETYLSASDFAELTEASILVQDGKFYKLSPVAEAYFDAVFGSR